VGTVFLVGHAAHWRFAGLDMGSAWQSQFDAIAPTLALTIVEIAEETLLAHIKVQRANAGSGVHQSYNQLDCRGGFARAAFLVAENDDMRAITHRFAHLNQYQASQCQTN
jgi:hypothetical protein